MARIPPVKKNGDTRGRTGGVEKIESLLPSNCNFLALLRNSSAAADMYCACETGLSRGQLTARQRESVALAVAEINGSNYCLSAHYALGKNTGLSDDEIRAARNASGQDPQTRAMLQFVRELTLQRGDVSDMDFEALRRAGFSYAQIVEIVANVALNIFTNYFNILARTEVDFPVLKPGRDAPAMASVH